MTLTPNTRDYMQSIRSPGRKDIHGCTPNFKRDNGPSAALHTKTTQCMNAGLQIDKYCMELLQRVTADVALEIIV
jgi:hypothetical protein